MLTACLGTFEKGRAACVRARQEERAHEMMREVHLIGQVDECAHYILRREDKSRSVCSTM